MIRLGLSVLEDGVIDINGISLSIGGSGATLRAALVKVLALLAVFEALGLLEILVVGVLATLKPLVVIVIVGIGVVLDKLID